MKIVIALGGNALIKKGEKQSFSSLLKHIKKICITLVPIVKNNSVVIIFGNGPEIGFLDMQNEIANKIIPKMPLDVLGAESQALIGYILEEQLINALRTHNLNKPIATLVTQVLVDKKDSAFRNPTKPIGQFYAKKQAIKLEKSGYVMIEDAGRGYRRVVPSPRPLRIIEIDIIRKLLHNGSIVIACGGGGIPVITTRGNLKGVEAVIDKDLAAACLGREIKANILLILTSVPFAYLNYMRKNQKPIYRMTVAQAKIYLDEKQFAIGSMKPKIEAAIDFLLNGGTKVIITDPEHCQEAIRGKFGTMIIR